MHYKPNSDHTHSTLLTFPSTSLYSVTSGLQDGSVTGLLQFTMQLHCHVLFKAAHTAPQKVVLLDLHQQIKLLLSHYYTLLYASDNRYNIETECPLYALSHYYPTIILLLSYYYTLLFYLLFYLLYAIIRFHPIIRYYLYYYLTIILLLYTIIHYYFTIILPIIVPIIRYYTFPPYYTLLSFLLYAIIRNANYYFNYLIFSPPIILVYFSRIEGCSNEKWPAILYETYLSFGISRNANYMDWSEPK